MQTCGEFEVVREIAWGSDASLYTTRAEGRTDAADLAVKIWRFPNSTSAALRAAAEQQAAIIASCTRLAPIYGSGHTDDGCAYYVTRLYALSVHRVIQARNKVSAKSLERFCTDVLRGLEELYEKCGRAHGNLKPSNILLDSDDPKTWRASLTDLAPNPEQATIESDLYELGCIVYQVVRHVARRPSLNPPVEFGPEWESLGEQADGWLAFCNLLLDRAGNSEPDAIHALLQKLRKIDALGRVPTSSEQVKPRRSRKRRSGVGVIFALVLILLGIGGGFYFWRNEPSVSQDDILRPEQLHDLVEAARGEPELWNLLVEKFPEGGKKIRTKTEFRKAVEQWSSAYQLKIVASDFFRKQGWTRLRLAVAEASNFELNLEFGNQIGKARKAASDCNIIESKWDNVKALQEELRSQDPTFNLVADLPQNYMEKLNDLAAARQFMDEATQQLREVVNYIDGEGRSRIDYVRFLAESKFASEVKIRPGEWLDEVKRFEKVPEDVVEKWKKRSDEDQAALAEMRLGSSEPSRVAFVATQEKIKALLKRSTANALVSEEADIGKNFETLEQEIKRLAKLESTPPPTTPIVVATPPALPMREADDEKFLAALRGLQSVEKLEQARSLFGDFETVVNMIPKYRDRKEVTDLRTNLRKSLESKFSIPVLEKKGWGKPVDAGDDWAVYRALAVDVPFRRIDLGSGKLYALSAIETPVEIAIWVTQQKLSGNQMLEKAPDLKGRKPNDGPSAWTPNPSVAKDYLWTQATKKFDDLKKNYPVIAQDSFLANADFAKVPQHAPMTFVSADEAKMYCEALGGELPPRELWENALRMEKGTLMVRGAAWNNQVKHLTDLENKVKNAQRKEGSGVTGFDGVTSKAVLWPDRGSFNPGGSTPPVASAAGGNDLWFSSVTRESEKREWGKEPEMCDLRGNVAEFVSDNDGKIRIIGSSAVSAPSSESISYASSPVGFSDVGFRLAVRLAPGDGQQLSAFQAAVREFASVALAKPQ